MSNLLVYNHSKITGGGSEAAAVSSNVYREAILTPSDRIIVALDNMDWPEAESVILELGSYIAMGKANSLAQKKGWEHAVKKISDLGAYAMADTKFHDIPETVRLQTKAVTECGASLITVHASGGEPMLRAAVAGRDRGKDSLNPSLMPFVKENSGQLGGILGITVLTSLDTDECVSIFGDEPEKKVVQFARMAVDAGIDGIVCSGKELRAIRAMTTLDSLITVVPGITPDWAKKPGDQKRVVTPRQALQDGADFLVLGRALTQPPNGISKTEAGQRVVAEIAGAQ